MTGMLPTRFFCDAFTDRKVLITGHTGFKGSWLTAWLLRLGAEVCGYSSGLPSEPCLFELGSIDRQIRHEIGDVRDEVRFSALIASFRPDYVFHLAAQAIVSLSYKDPLETFSTNVMGTTCILQALRKIDWPCVATIITSDKCYENVEWPWGYREIDRLGGKDVYSASKGAAELAFHAFLHSFFNKSDVPIRIATTRAGNVIGGGDWAADRIVADCIRSWTNGETVEIRSPQATRPWQHVLEPLSGYLALAMRLAKDKDLHGESFNFGPRAEQNHTVVRLLQDLARVWGHEDPPQSFTIVDNIPFHEAGLLKLSCDKALQRLRWEPNLSYEECVGLTGGWYRDVMKNKSDALEVTTSQIGQYEELALLRHRVWCDTAA